jgi:hypothetical protein
MGLFSGSRSTSSQTTNNVDRRVAVQDGIGISGDGNALELISNTTTNLLDGGAIAEAFGFGRANSADAFRTTRETSADAFDFARGAFDFSKSTSADAFRTTRETSADAFDFARGAFDFSKSTSADALRTTRETYGRALDSIDANSATLGEGYERLLDAADSLWNRSEKLIGQTQQSVADAYVRAQDTARGTIDNRTIIVLAVVGAAALFLGTRGRK